MSVEKLDFQKVIREHIPYTLISTKVIQNIADPVAGFIWVYLSSLPPEWTVNKAHLKNHFKIGDDKLKQVLAYLAKVQLIEYVQTRCANGTIAHIALHVLCGDRFLNNHVDNEVCASTGVKTTRVENHTSGFPPLIKETKEQTKLSAFKTKEQKQYSCASGDAQSRFDDFWKAYPRKVNKIRTAKLWHKLKLDERADEILADIALRKTNDAQWQQLQYVPHPSTYLNGQRWQDEITPSNTCRAKIDAPAQAKSGFASVSHQSTSFVPYAEQQRRDKEAKMRHEEFIRTYQ